MPGKRRHPLGWSAEMSAQFKQITVEPRTLREIIKSAGGSMGEFTVMSAATDPYRIDTEANHRDAQWLADAWNRLRLRKIHARGLHYALLSLRELTMLNRGGYENTDENWIFLQRIVGYARWLGYIDFDAIVDERNAGPELYEAPYVAHPGVYIDRDVLVPYETPTLPSIEAACEPPHARQAYKLVIIGEKASLGHVLRPICRRFEADLVLPTGELSTTLLQGIVSRAADDGRPCRIFYLSDFDPSGLHMPVEVSRKIQALCDLKFQALDIEVRRCALLADQVRTLGLPETPMKATEKRAGKWRERFGCEQTEIDALATLQPEVLVNIVERDLQPYFDSTLQRRQRQAYETARQETQRRIDQEMVLHEERLAVAEALMQDAARAFDAATEYATPLFEQIADNIEPAVPAVVQPELDEAAFSKPLFSSRNSFDVTTAILLEEKL
ncbi:MAG: hypothetical protein ABIN37_09100 [Burkholderiaceae bacterium]